jgi:EmrB/QacA subfamily drug resistance transporter
MGPAALNISDADRQWVVTAYTLTFGGLLLLGGRVADLLSRKRVFTIGLAGFALASALGGLAPDSAVLFGARALQGGFAAVMAPAALSLLAVTFTEAKERATAFSVYGGISGGGAAIGLILGGVLTEYASWRWCLLVNVPVALITAACAVRLVRESRAEGPAHYDIPGAATVTLGLAGLVYGFTEAETDGWGSPTTLAFLVVAVLLLTAFVTIEARSAHPLLPLRVVLERNRAGAFLAALLSGTGLFGMFLFLTYYLQGTLHYSALKSGFAFLPFSAGIVIGAGLTSQLLPRFGPRNLLAPGLLLAAGGLLWFTRIGVSASYALHVLPAEIVVSIGMGLVFVTVASTALVGVADRDAGVPARWSTPASRLADHWGPRCSTPSPLPRSPTTSSLTTGPSRLAWCTVTGWPSRSAPPCSPPASWPRSCSSGPAATTCPTPGRQTNPLRKAIQCHSTSNPFTSPSPMPT